MSNDFFFSREQSWAPTDCQSQRMMACARLFEDADWGSVNEPLVRAREISISSPPTEVLGTGKTLKSSMLSAELSEWTIAVNIASNEKSGLKDSADAKMKSLEELAERTKERPITFVVSRVLPPTTEASGGDDSPPIVEKYVIRDGKIKKTGTVKSRGLAEDTGELVRDATENHKSKKFALFMFCHGHGNKGLTGDAGNATIAEFVSNIKRNLPEGKQIDVLDFDNCLMAQDGVVASLRGVARRLVASTELEAMDKEHFHGQNQSAYFSRLIENPKMSAKLFGELIIDEARRGSNGAPSGKVDETKPVLDRTGTASLSLINLERSKEFEDHVNTFGEKLLKACENPTIRRRILDIIDATPRFGARDFDIIAGDTQKRDLKTFAESIREGINAGQISDRGGELKASCNAVLSSLVQVVEQLYGFPGRIDRAENAIKSRYDEVGGISVFLPGSLFLSAEKQGLMMTPVGALIEILVNDKYPASFKTDLAKVKFEELKKGVPEDEQEVLNDLRDAISTFVSSRGCESGDFDRARESLLREARKHLHWKYNKQKLEQHCGFYQGIIEETYKAETANYPNSGWNRFVRSLSSCSRIRDGA